MNDFTGTELINCVVHIVGNKNLDEKLSLSANELSLDLDLKNSLTEYFLKPFKNISESYKFHHDIDLKMNEVFVCSGNIFEGEDFVANAQNIAKHLYNQTTHPAIKPGELFIALLDEVMIDGMVCKAIGIFKSEKKENFFRVSQDGRKIKCEMEHGIYAQRLDKGCLIIQDEEQDGFKVFTYEQGNSDAVYWRDDFLSIIVRQDNYYQTQNFLNLCKDFVTTKIPTEYEVTKADQIQYLNKSVEYFKNNTDFKSSDFANEVFQDPELVKSFKKYKTHYEEEQDLSLENQFDISSTAVKKQARVFKSVLKLDKNFHVYIHGDTELIEKGYDAKTGKHFYKIYFDKEQ